MNDGEKGHYRPRKLHQSISHEQSYISSDSSDDIVNGICSGLNTFGKCRLDIYLGQVEMPVCPKSRYFLELHVFDKHTTITIMKMVEIRNLKYILQVVFPAIVLFMIVVMQSFN